MEVKRRPKKPNGYWNLSTITEEVVKFRCIVKFRVKCPNAYNYACRLGVLAQVRAAMKLDEIRFWSRVKKTKTCWIWVHSKDRDGYGLFKAKGFSYRAHRFSLKITDKEPPNGMVVDHVCRNRACVNPSHLRVVSPGVNSLENSLGLGALNHRKTHCKRGHPFSGKNLVMRPDRGTRGLQRTCRICRNNCARDSYKRKVAKNAGLKPRQVI